MTYGILFFASLTHIINACNKTELCSSLITDGHFIIYHYFVIKINLKINFASYGHFVCYENNNSFFVLYIFIKYIGHDKCVKTDKNYLILVIHEFHLIFSKLRIYL